MLAAGGLSVVEGELLHGPDVLQRKLHTPHTQHTRARAMSSAGGSAMAVCTRTSLWAAPTAASAGQDAAQDRKKGQWAAASRSYKADTSEPLVRVSGENILYEEVWVAAVVDETPHTANVLRVDYLLTQRGKTCMRCVRSGGHHTGYRTTTTPSVAGRRVCSATLLICTEYSRASLYMQ